MLNFMGLETNTRIERPGLALSFPFLSLLPRLFLNPNQMVELRPRSPNPTKMAAFRTNLLLREIFHARPSVRFRPVFPALAPPLGTYRAQSCCIRTSRILCMAPDSGDTGKKVSARLSQIQDLLQKAEERSLSADSEPTPKITLDYVTVNFARSGGPGGQNVNKVNTKVDMRFNIQNAYWLSDRIRERIMQMEKNRINKDGELVISSTKTRTQKGNIEDALEKLQAIIDAAAYVPPPPSEEQKKKIAKLAAAGEQKRLQSKKALSQKKAFRRSRDSWD